MPAEVIVTVRMPTSLVTALKQRTEQDHYTDFSEQVRSIVRKGCLQYTNPVTNELKDLKTQLKQELKDEQAEARAEALLASLKELIKGGDAQ